MNYDNAAIQAEERLGSMPTRMAGNCEQSTPPIWESVNRLGKEREVLSDRLETLESRLEKVLLTPNVCGEPTKQDLERCPLDVAICGEIDHLEQLNSRVERILDSLQL